MEKNAKELKEQIESLGKDIDNDRYNIERKNKLIAKEKNNGK